MEPLVVVSIATALVGFGLGAVFVLYPKESADWLWKNYPSGKPPAAEAIARGFGVGLILLAAALCVIVASLPGFAA
ncbi:hypothetical protein [Microbacterium kunmingense]|uniref:hypothetical protein n=1 Tax=Microbacterium kunmingense TaxID=2915939 RepID=UPI003D710AF7